jgi:TetR/AcrR family transcriptional regulator
VSEARGGGRERILAAAMETLEEHGEAAIRFADVAERAGVVPSVVAHHFGTREGLLAALHEQRYVGLAAEDEDALRVLIESATTREEFAAGIALITAGLVERDRMVRRMTRIASIGASQHREELAEHITRVVTGLLDTLTDVVITGQRLGLVDPTVPPRALATFIHAYAIGMIANDLDARPAPPEDLVPVIARALGAFMIDRPS